MVDVNWVALIVGAVVYNAVGFAWYSDSLFGKAWRKESGLSKEQYAKGSMGKMFASMAVTSLVMAYVMSVVFSVFQANTVSLGLQGAFWLWLGFVATVQSYSVTYEMKSWKYFGINAGYQLVGMLAMGTVLVMLG